MAGQKNQGKLFGSDFTQSMFQGREEELRREARRKHELAQQSHSTVSHSTTDDNGATDGDVNQPGLFKFSEI
jgi:hypothetical protein